MEELVDSWNFNFSNDFRFLPYYIHGIIYADAACKFYSSTFHVILGGTIKVTIQGLIITKMNEDVHAQEVPYNVAMNGQFSELMNGQFSEFLWFCWNNMVLYKSRRTIQFHLVKTN